MTHSQYFLSEEGFSLSKEKSIESVNAEINKDYIISGKNGQKIDVNKAIKEFKNNR